MIADGDDLQDRVLLAMALLASIIVPPAFLEDVDLLALGLFLMILGIVRSYDIFPIGKIPDVAGMSELLTNAVAGAFLVGIQITAPFLVLILLLYIGMGIMSKLMPQVQVFMIAVPVQIYLALVTLALVISGMLLVWLDQFEKGMKFFLMSGG